MPVALLSGCSSGFGLLASVELARAGFRVFATMRNLSKRSRLDEACRAADVSVEIGELDVTSQDSIDRAVARAGSVDVLVNNAGYGLGGFVEDVEMDELRAQFETNFFGLVALTKAVLPSMRERRSGRIINLSSIGGLFAVPAMSAYCASKFAVEGFSESLRYEARADGIWVSLIEPGSFKTEIFYDNRRTARRAFDPGSAHHAASLRISALLDQMLEKNHRDPADVARLIVRAATARRPRLRYVVGADAWGERAAKALLPERALEAVVLRAARLMR